MDLIRRTFQVPHTSSLQAFLGHCHPLRRSIQPRPTWTTGVHCFDIRPYLKIVQRNRLLIHNDPRLPLFPSSSQAGVARHSEGHHIKAFQMASALVRWGKVPENLRLARSSC